MSEDDDYTALTGDLDEDTRLCVCGCSETEHASGPCLFCGDCDEFTYDPDAALIAAIFEDLP